MSKSILNQTIEHSIEAKKSLIETGHFQESDFDVATQMDVQLGYLIGEFLVLKGDDCTSAIDLWNGRIY